MLQMMIVALVGTGLLAMVQALNGAAKARVRLGDDFDERD